MPFDNTAIVDIVAAQDGPDLHLSWTPAGPGFGAGGFGAGGLGGSAAFQVYAAGRLAWHGYDPYCTIPRPDSFAGIFVGAVGPGEELTDFSSSLPVPAGTGGDRARLAWVGGGFEAPDLAGFRVYGAATAGGAIDYAAALATIVAYPGGVATDGFGALPFGVGGFGGGSYSWTSGHMGPGTWPFAVVPFDSAGNAGTPATASVVLAGPPRPPAPSADGTRLRYALAGFGSAPFGAGGFGRPSATLTWNPSPG